MATYNKPGVYVEETLTPNIPTSGTNSTTVATFIGFADRGPTTVVSSAAYGVPTRVTSPSQFYTLFSFNNTPAPFSSTIATKIGTDGDALKYAVQSFFDNGGSEAYILRDLYTDASTSSITLADNSSVLVQGATWNFVADDDTNPTTVTISATGTPFTGIEPNRVVYFSGITAAGYTDLNNKKWVVSAVATNGANLSVRAKKGTTTSVAQTLDATAPATIRGAVTAADGATNKTIKITANSHGVWGNYLWAEVRQGVAENTFDLNLYYNPSAVTTADLTSAHKVDSYVGLSMDPTSSQYFVTKINGVSPWITVSDEGQANIVSTVATGAINTLTLTVATGFDKIRKGMVVTGAGIASGTAPTVVTNVSSGTITLSAKNTAAISTGTAITFSSSIGYADLPVFTSYWSSAITAANISSTDYSFVWNTANIATGNVASNAASNQTLNTLKVNAVKLASLSGDTYSYPTNTSNVNSNINTAKSIVTAVSTGANGSTASDLAANVLPRLDAITNGMVINYPNKVDSTSVNALTKYAATRGDSFVVIDSEVTSPGPNGVGKTVKDAITAGASYNVNPNYGALYYPAIQVKDPSTSVSGKRVLIPAGGAVVAAYLSSDASRGIHKAPAGVSAILGNALGAYALTNDDFNLVNSSTPYLNIIRQISGNYCIMGARTLSSQNIDIYISIRRTLNYLATALKAQTQFAVFEPNDSYLWTKVSSVANNFLYAFWKQNGLAGDTPEQAYYVKCDSDINTAATIATGQLNIEVGVALQYPAEFVVIRIGQIDSGATATTSI